MVVVVTVTSLITRRVGADIALGSGPSWKLVVHSQDSCCEREKMDRVCHGKRLNHQIHEVWISGAATARRSSRGMFACSFPYQG